MIPKRRPADQKSATLYLALGTCSSCCSGDQRERAGTHGESKSKRYKGAMKGFMKKH